jgi:hypothetical protein
MKPAGTSSATTRTEENRRRHRESHRFEVAVEGAQSDAHLLFMKEFLAPLLAREFLRQRSASGLKPTSEVNASVSTSGTSYRRDGR